MENQKVRDLSTAQSPKATDFVMLITNLTNNVLEKCQISELRDLITTNSISDDEDNALTTGSDDKLYVPDLTENIGIVASNLNDLSDDVNTVTNNLNALTGQVGQIQTKVNNIYSSIAPDYSKGVNISSGWTANKNGLIKFFGHTSNSNGIFAYVNGVEIARFSGWSYGGKTIQNTAIFPISQGETYTATATGDASVNAIFFPIKGNGPNEGGGIGDLLG